MKRIISLLSILLTLVPALTAQTLTVADDPNGVEMSEWYIPVYGYYMDAEQRSQTIYPDTMLSAMTGKYITELTYYFATAPNLAWGGTQTVKIGETTATDLGDGFVASPSTLVWTGTLSSNISNSQMHIVLDQPFLYSGGNLLIEIENPTAATWEDSYFAGQSQLTPLSYMTWNDYGTPSNHAANFLPRLTFTYASTLGCLAPYSPIVSLNGNSATFAWSPSPSSVSNYTIGYKSSTDTSYTNTIVTDTFLVINNLSPNQTYQWRVRSNCGEEEFSLWRDGPSIYIPAITAHVPYNCDFENPAEYSQWIFLNDDSVNKWCTGEAVAYQGNRSLYVSNDDGLNNAYSAGSGIYSFIWAYRDIDFDTIYSGHRLSFSGRNHNYYNNMNHGFLKVFIGPPVTPADDSAPAGAIQLGSDIYNQSNWKTYSFLLDESYQGVFRLYYYWENTNIYLRNPPAAIDNITIESYNCSMPEQLTTTEIDTGSAVLSWHSPIVGTADSYTLAFKKQSDTTFSEIEVTDTTYTITGLSASTNYEWKVRAHCSSNDESEWSELVQFITAPLLAQLPYFCGFEDSLENQQWRFTNFLDEGWFIGTATAHTGNHSLYISNDGGVSHAVNQAVFNYHEYHEFWVCRDVNFTPGYANYQISFDYKGIDDAWSNLVLYICNVGEGASATYTYTPAETLFSQYISAQDSDWHHLSLTVDSTYQGVKRIYFHFNNSFDLCDPPAAIDNLTITGNICQSVQNLQTIIVSDTFAVLAWNPVGADNYTVAYKTDDETEFTEVQTSDTTLQLNGLFPSTFYEWKVQAHCSDSTESYWSEPNSFITIQLLAHLPYFCDFENADENARWETTVTYGNNQWFIGNAANSGGTSSIYISQDNGLTNTFDVNSTSESGAYRDIYFDPEYKEYLLSFDIQCQGNNLSMVTVHIGSASNFDNDAVQITEELYEIPEWIHYKVVLDSTFAGSRRLYLKWFNTYSSYSSPGETSPAAFDNISISGVSCSKPVSLSVTDISLHSASISWSSGYVGTADSYTVAYRKNTETDFAEVTVSDTSMILTDLQSSSHYFWKVRANCQEGETSDWSAEKELYTFAELPYSCGFETAEESDLWVLHYKPLYENTVIHENRWSVGEAAHSTGTSAIYISNDDGLSNTYSFNSGCTAWATLNLYLAPAYPLYQISFDFKGIGEQGKDYMQVYCGGPTYTSDQSSFPNNVEQIGGDFNLTEDWTTFTFTLDSTYAGYKQLYLSWTNNYFDGENPPAAIDNIVIIGSSCGIPTNMTQQISDSTALLQWSVSLGAPESYILAYKKTADSVFTEINTSDTFLLLTPLLPLTDYVWKVRAVCDDSTQSFWSNDAIFTTTQSLPNFPYLCSFDNSAENSHWTTLNGSDENQWVIGNATGFGDNSALFISNDSGSTNAYTITSASSVWAYRDINFEENHIAYQLSFDFKGKGQNTADYMQVFIGKPVVPSDTTIPDGAVQLGGQFSEVNDWAHFSFTLDSTYAGVQRIYFLWVNNNSIGGQPPAAVDNLSVCGLSCITPSDLAIVDMTATEATLRWSPSPHCQSDSYTVCLRLSGSTTTTEYTTADTFYVVSGLTPSKTYYCKVRANCSTNEHSGWSSDLCIRMPATLPYICNFEDLDERNAWQTVNGSYINQWHIGNAVSNGGNYSLYISNDGGASYAFSQGSTTYYSYVWAYRDIYFDPSDSVYTLSFDFRGAGGTSWQYSSYANVYIGNPVIPNGSSVPSGLTTLATSLCGMPAWTNKTYTLDHSYAGVQRLYFYWTNSSYAVSNPPAAIDNINIEGTTCANVPSNLTTQVMDTLANLSWTLANGSAESYTVGYKLQYDTVFTYITVQDEHVLLSDLTPLTNYIWKVRANCTASDHSLWSSEDSFITPEGTARIPYNCDFENATENNRWTILNGNYTNKWCIGSAVNNGGSNALYISNDNGVTNAYNVNSLSKVWAYRDIYFDPEYSQFLISFNFKGLGENYNNSAWDFAKLFIGPNTSFNLSSAPPQGSTQIGTYLYLQNDWTTIQDTLNVLSETGMQRIYFLWENDGSLGDNPPAAIDNLSIVPFGCGRPMNPVTIALSTNSATLSWDGTTNDFEVAYKLTSDSNYTTLLTSEHSVTIGNLLSDSEYEWKVKTICSDSSESEWSASVIFTTYQSIAHLPYFCDFENDYENSNWAVVGGNTNLWTIGDAVSNGGSHSLYVTADNGVTNSYTHNSTYSIWTYRDIYFDEGFAEYELEFDYKGIGNSNHYGNIYIGTPAIPHPESNAVPADATLLTQKLYGKPEWSHYSITLDATHSGAQRLYFLWTVANTSSTAANPPAAIDNVTVLGRNCVKPSNLQSANVTHNSASVSWTHASSENFIVAYRVAGASFFEEAQANQNSLILTDLLSSTTYVWKVKAVCDSSEESAWSTEKTFTTNYSIAELPYINGFEDEYENNQWRFLYQGSNPTQWTFGSATSQSGSNAFYISTDGGATNTYANGYYNSWAWRDIYIDSATTQIQISFDYKGMGHANPYGSDYGRLLFGVPTTPYYVNTDGITDLTGELKLIPDWTHYHYVVDVSNITGVRRIYLHWHTENSEGSNPAAFDNLTIVGGNCGLPNNLTIDNVTQNSISFHFTPSSESDVEWQVVIAPEGTDINENQIVSIVDTFYTFTGLNHSSLYKIYVRNVCEEDAFWNYTSQYTECGPISELPFVENFDVNTTPANINLEFPRCWARSNTNVAIDNFNISSLEFGETNLIAVLPEIDSSIAVSDLHISFTMKYFNYTPSRIVVGVMDNPSDSTTFMPIDEVLSSPAQEWTFRHVPLNSYTGSGRYIALKSLNWTYVDDLVIDHISGCSFPTHVTITGVSNNSVSLTWTPTGDETEWQVIVVEQDSDTATTIPQTTTANSYTYSGLLPSTEYVAYVRAACGDGGFSTWEKTDPFTTVCDPVSAFPIVENFDEFPIPTVWTFELPRPECWTFPELYGMNYPGVDFYESYSGTNSLKFIAGASNNFASASFITHATAVSPMLDADIHQLSVRFILKSNWLYYPQGMEVGVMSDPYDMSTFEPVELIIPQTSDVWYEYVVSFDSTQLSGHGNYIVFRYTSTYNQRFNWIDDIVIDYTSHIFTSAPTNLVATNITESSADLSWDQESSLVSGWYVEYRKSEESEWSSLFVNDMSCHLSNLESDKLYVARVAARFGEQISDYSNECTFVTLRVGISDHALEAKVSVYPNPAHQYLMISSGKSVCISHYKLYSIDGKLLQTATAENLPIQVPVANLANGIYLLEIVCDEGVLVKKIVKR